MAPYLHTDFREISLSETRNPPFDVIDGDKSLKSQTASDNRLPSLDGLRALSIMMVLLGHISGTHGFRRIDLGIGNYAQLGVTVFFVISGFLITSLLIAEDRATGRISL